MRLLFVGTDSGFPRSGWWRRRLRSGRRQPAICSRVRWRSLRVGCIAGLATALPMDVFADVLEVLQGARVARLGQLGVLLQLLDALLLGVQLVVAYLFGIKIRLRLADVAPETVLQVRDLRWSNYDAISKVSVDWQILYIYSICLICFVQLGANKFCCSQVGCQLVRLYKFHCALAELHTQE